MTSVFLPLDLASSFDALDSGTARNFTVIPFLVFE